MLVLSFKPLNDLRRNTAQGLLSSLFGWGTRPFKRLSDLSKGTQWASAGVGARFRHKTSACMCLYHGVSPEWNVCSTENQGGKRGNYPMDYHHEYNFLQREFLVFIYILSAVGVNLFCNWTWPSIAEEVDSHCRESEIIKPEKIISLLELCSAPALYSFLGLDRASHGFNQAHFFMHKKILKIAATEHLVHILVSIRLVKITSKLYP